MKIQDTWTGTIKLEHSTKDAAVRHWRADMRSHSRYTVATMHNMSRTVRTTKVVAMTTAQSKSLVKRR